MLLSRKNQLNLFRTIIETVLNNNYRNSDYGDWRKSSLFYTHNISFHNVFYTYIISMDHLKTITKNCDNRHIDLKNNTRSSKILCYMFNADYNHQRTTSVTNILLQK